MSIMAVIVFLRAHREGGELQPGRPATSLQIFLSADLPPAIALAGRNAAESIVPEGKKGQKVSSNQDSPPSLRRHAALSPLFSAQLSIRSTLS